METATGTASLTDVITTTTPNALVMSAATQGNAGALTATGTGHVRDFTVAGRRRKAGGHVGRDVGDADARLLREQP